MNKERRCTQRYLSGLFAAALMVCCTVTGFALPADETGSYSEKGVSLETIEENAVSSVRTDEDSVLIQNLGSSEQRAGSFEFVYEDDAKTVVSGYKGIVPATVEIPEGVREIGSRAFYRCESLETVQLPETLQSIERYAFYGTGLRSVVIPSGVQDIYMYAFGLCELLETVKLPNTLRAIHEGVFSATGLRSVIIPFGVQEIDWNAFYRCKSLETVQLSETLQRIGPHAFYGCESLETIQIPETLRLRTAGYDIFKQSSPKEVFFGGTEEQWRAIGWCTGDRKILEKAALHFNAAIPNPGETPTADPNPIPSDTPATPQPSSPTYVKLLTEYNASAGTVKFRSANLNIRTDGVDNKLNAESSVPADLSSLVGSYVFVTYQPYDEKKYDPVYIRSIEPVQPEFGLVTQVGAGDTTSAASTITVDGTTYTSSLSELSALKDTRILYFVRNGQLLAYFPTVQKAGKLTAITGSSLTVGDTQITRGSLTPSLPDLDGATGLYVVAQSVGGQLVGLEIPSTVAVSAPDAFLTGQSGQIILSGQYGSGQNGARWTVKSSDPGVISFGGNAEASSPAPGTALSQFKASIPVVAKSSGKAILTCTLPNGTEQRVNVQVMTQEEKELQERLKEWELAFQAYMKDVQNVTKETGAAQPDKAELRELSSVLLSKLKSEYGLQLTTQMGKETPEMQVAVCSAVLQLLYECYSSAPEVSRPKTAAETVTETLKACVNLKTTYTNSETGETVDVTIQGTDLFHGGTSGPKIGQAVYRKDGKSVITVISGDLVSLAKAAGYFMDDLDKIYGSIGEDTLKTCAKEIAKCAFGMSLSKMMESGAEAMLSKHSDMLRKLGVGEVLTIYKAGKQIYGLTFGLKATDILDPSGMAKEIDGLADFSFNESSAVQKSAKALISGLKQATKNVAKSLRKLSGSTSPVPVDSVVKALFQCPVDVEIYNTSGKQIGYIGDSAPSWSEGTFTVGYLGEAKQIISEGEPLVFKVRSTGWGTMSYMVEEVRNGVGTSRAVYYDLPLTPSASYSVRTPASGVSPGTIEVQQGTSSVPASLTLDSAHYVEATYNVVAEPSDVAAGTVRGNGSYVAGDAVVLYGEPNAGYSFDWWETSDGMLLSLDSTYQFTAAGPVSIIAVFSEDPDYVPATPDLPPTVTDPPKPEEPTPPAKPAPGIVAVKGYQAGYANNRPYYVKVSGASMKYYLRSNNGKMTRVAAPGVKAGAQSYYPVLSGSSVLFPQVENGKVTCYCAFRDGMEIPVLAVQAEASPAMASGYQTGTVNGRTYYVKVSGASMKYYLKSSSGKMTRVAAPSVTDADKTRYYPINYGGTVLFPKLMDGKLAAYITGIGETVLVAL